MAAKADEQQQAGGEKKKSGKLLLFAIIGLVLVVNLLLVGRIFLTGKKKPEKETKKVEEVGAKVALEEFIVNLAGEGDHYLKATLAVGLKKGLTEEAVKEETPPIRDAILSVLCSKSRRDMAGEAGREKLKEQLKEKINKVLGEEKIVKVYLMSFTTQ